jgi:hypothetical protein
MTPSPHQQHNQQTSPHQTRQQHNQHRLPIPSLSLAPSAFSSETTDLPSNASLTSSVSATNIGGVAFGQTLINRKTTVGKAIKKRQLNAEQFESVDFYSNFPSQAEEEEEPPQNEKTPLQRGVRKLAKYTTKSIPVMSALFLIILAIIIALMNSMLSICTQEY